MSAHTPGPWIVATSNSWRRIVSYRTDASVCEPIKQNDGHPDLYFRNGGAGGPDARLIEAAPDLLEALIKCVHELDLITGKVHDERCALAAGYAAIAKATGGTT